MSEFAANYAQRQSLRKLPRADLSALQLTRLNQLLAEISPQNVFYRQKLGEPRLPLASLDEFTRWPTTHKEELAAPPAPGQLAVNQTWPTNQYARYHQTSGTSGRPQAVLETRADWQWWMDVWQTIYDAADVRPGDRVLLAFSFGPFIGFWSAFDAAVARGCLLLPAGGMSSAARLEMAQANQVNVILCTPSYALHLAEVGRRHHLPVAALGVRQLVLAGEPGGSIPSVRAKISAEWQAAVHDHAGATEVGPWGVGDAAGEGLFVIESDFIAEFFTPGTDEPAPEGELAELVLSCLGRAGCPILRYRTRDLVRPVWRHGKDCGWVFLPGGILGRADDMLVVRGVNIFPSSVEAILREFAGVEEFRVTVTTAEAMDQLAIEVEDANQQHEVIAETLRSRLGLKVLVHPAPAGSLPRFEGKGKRWVDLRGKNNTSL